MGKRLERFGEVRIIDETNGFGLQSKRGSPLDTCADSSITLWIINNTCPISLMLRIIFYVKLMIFLFIQKTNYFFTIVSCFLRFPGIQLLLTSAKYRSLRTSIILFQIIFDSGLSYLLVPP